MNKISSEIIAEERLWHKRIDGIAIQKPTQKRNRECFASWSLSAGRSHGSVFRKSQTGGRLRPRTSTPPLDQPFVVRCDTRGWVVKQAMKIYDE
jgi:hypothetical protein